MLGRNVIKMIKGKGVSAGIGFGNIVILKNEIRKIEKNLKSFFGKNQNMCEIPKTKQKT